MSTFIGTFTNSFVNIIPSISQKISQQYSIGNEYSILITLILTELSKNILTNSSEILIYVIFFIFALCSTISKMGLGFKIKLFNSDKNIIKLIGKEDYSQSNACIFYCNKILNLNNFLLYDKKIKNVLYVNDTTVLINDIIDFELEKDIYLTINRPPVHEKQSISVTYLLWSYKKNIDEFLQKINNVSLEKEETFVILVGNEDNTCLNYSKPIKALIDHVKNKYQFPRIKCMKIKKDIISLIGHDTKNENEFESENNNTNSTDNDYLYTLNDIMGFNMDGIFLDVYRENENVYFKIYSKLTDCKKWIDGIINSYENSKFKYNSIVLSGYESSCYWSGKTVQYTDDMIALGWYLVEKMNYKNFEYVKYENVKYSFNACNFNKIDDDLYLSVLKIKTDYKIEIKYCIHSLEKNLTEFLNII